MYSISFNLKKPNKRSETLIYMYVFYKKQRIKLSTKQSIHPMLWDKDKNAVTKNAKAIKNYQERYLGIQDRLLIIQNKLDELVKEVDRFNMICTMKGASFSLPLLKDHLKGFLEGSNYANRNEQRICIYLNGFIDEIQSGSRRLPSGKKYRTGTIKNYKNLLQALKRFEKNQSRTYKWDDINRTFYNKLLEWHESNDLSLNYTGKHVKDLKALMKVAFEEGVHSNDEFTKRYFSPPKEDRKKIPLTFEEVERIENLQIAPDDKLRLPREVFLLGCYLGLRISDIRRITSDKFRRSGDDLLLVMKTKKTGREVKIPVNSKAQEILETYDYTLPKFHPQVINRHLKTIGKLIVLPSARANKLSMHISRCTFAKLSYEMGISSMFIMSITGHASEKNFLRYINIQPDRAAQEFRKHDYFK